MKIVPFLTAALATILCSGCVMPPKSYQKPVPGKVGPHAVKTGKFWWGTSTSSYQNEDRGVSPDSPFYFQTDWDKFAEEGHIPPRGDDATFSWSRFDKDVAALKELGVTHYRFGIEWARVEPQPGVYNEAAIRQYARMAQKLKANGIEPIVTLWHFTFPDWLYDGKNKARSNFLHPDVQERWHAFVDKMAGVLSPYVRTYVPQNEPNGDLYIGYFGGHWPPGLLLTPGALKKANRVAIAMYRDAAATVRKHRSDAIIMGIYSIPNWRRNHLQDPTAFVYNMMQRQNFDHLDAVADVTDIIGVNYYYSQDASALRFIVRPHGEITSNYTQNGWEIDAEGLYNVLKQVSDRYDKPIVVSENGIGTQSEQKKVRYFREHLAQVKRALADGVDVRGYFAWTLVDNYEWAEGFGANFGLSTMTDNGRRLLLEPSGRWFANHIRANPNP
jgi:beta-glucosidase